jgi:hypothetical protein
MLSILTVLGIVGTQIGLAVFVGRCIRAGSGPPATAPAPGKVLRLCQDSTIKTEPVESIQSLTALSRGVSADCSEDRLTNVDQKGVISTA